MPCSADRYRGDPAGVVAGHREGDHADRLGRVRPDPQHPDLRQPGQPGQQPLPQRLLVRRDALRRRTGRELLAGPGQGRRAQDVRRAALVPGGRGRPVRCSRYRHLAHRAAAGQVRGRRVQPVASADQHARAVGRVELVPGQGQVVDPGLPPARRAGAGRAAPRPPRSGRRAGARSGRARAIGSTSPVTFEAPVTASSAVGVAASAASRSASVSRSVGAASSTASPRRCHGSRFAWCSMSR